jgi:YebC/PmpR family DNA-binding regulatory protein
MVPMSGHSKWATTKHKKAVIDARRAKSFAKLIKNIEVAAKIGGADLSGNPTLVDAVQKAKKTSVPNDNIDRAIKRGAGLTGESVDYQTIMYEGYGPNGVALLIECLTDNRNRAAAEVRTAMSRNGGTMADPGSVAYNFTRKGVISITKEGDVDEDAILEAVLDAGAEEVKDRGAGFEVVTDTAHLVTAREALQAAGIDYDSSEAEFVPDLSIEVDAETARKVFRLIDALEDSDDVQNVYANYEVTAAVQAELDEDD